MDKDAAKQAFSQMPAACNDIEMATRSLTGTSLRATWEAEISFTCLADFPGSAYKKGDGATTAGVSLVEWNGDGKVVKQSDYYCWRVSGEQH